jgi:3,2-trans-enoyl-CoA isomerase
MVKPDPTRCRNFWTALQDMWNTLYTYRLPTVALINVSLDVIICTCFGRKRVQTLNFLNAYFFFGACSSEQGHAPAGGCLISCGCDYRVMIGGQGFNIGLNETKLGIVAPFW